MDPLQYRSGDENVERYRSIIETAVDAVITIDETGHIESANPATERMFGYREAELVGRKVEMLMPEPDRSRHDGYINRYLDSGERRIIGTGREVTCLRRDGSRFPAHLSVGEMRVAGRRMFTGILRDISDRVSAEERLRSSEERHRAIVETAVDGIITIAANGVVHSMNEAAERIFGFAQDEVVGRNVSMLMPEPDRSGHDGYLSRYLAGGAPRIIGVGREVTGRRRDGSTFPMHLAVSEMRLGGERAFTGIVRDISELKRAEAEARSRRDYAAALVASMQDGLAVLALDGELLEVNRRYCEIAGFPADELVGRRPPFPHWPADVAARQVEDLRRLLEAGSGEQDMIYERSDGERVEVIVSVARLHDPEGRITGHVSTVKDVTERRRSEVALRASEARLQAEQEATRLKDEFLALVSHELRTPLTSVIGYLEALEEEERLSEQGQRFVSVIDRNAQRLLRLVGDVLLLAQAESGRLELRMADLDLAEAARRCLEEARPQADAKDISLHTSLRGVPLVRADGARVAQVLDNLVGNAIKFTPRGGWVRIDLEAVDGVAALTVSDSGPGVPAAERPRLFERFYRAAAARDGVVPGSGLGLAIVRVLVEAHGGRITIDGEDGRGAVFRVELPVVAPWGDAGEAQPGNRVSYIA